MKRSIAAVFGLPILLAIPTFVSAKGDTSKITITGGDLGKPLEITDPEILKAFNVWTGPGVTAGGVDQMEGFIIDWRSGVVTRPAGLRRYTLTFLVREHNEEDEQPAYVVGYERGASAQEGYVYLPGRAEEWGVLNTRAIYRGREGNWFRATEEWDRVMDAVLTHSR